MAVQSYALFAIIAALFGFGIYRILAAEQTLLKQVDSVAFVLRLWRSPNLARIGLHWRMT